MLPPADVGPTAQSHEARGWWEAWDYNKSSPSTVFAALNFTDWQGWRSMALLCHLILLVAFPQHCINCVSTVMLGNSCNISNFFKILSIVVCGSLVLLL